jgi:hypothetical protein
MPYRQIIEKYRLEELFPELDAESFNSVLTHVFNGYQNGDGSFKGLISPEDSKAARLDNIRKYAYPASLGSLSKEERVRNASKAGAVSYEKKVGIHGRAEDVALADRKKGGRNSVLNRGLNPWSDGESLLIYVLDKSGVYGKEGVCSKVNELWGNGRSVQAVKNQLSRFRKKYTGLSDFL